MALVSIVSSDSSPQSIRKVVDMVGGMHRIVKRGDLVLSKPNFVAPLPEATTNLGLVSEIVQEVGECGGEPLIGESSGIEFDTEKTFELLGVKKLANDLGVRLINFEREEFASVKTKHKLVRSIMIPKVVLDSDVLINLPKLKVHRAARATLGMKNLFGILHKDSRRKIHITGLDWGIAAINAILAPDLTVIDGLSVLDPGPVFGKSIPFGIMAASRDVVSLDQFCCRLLSIDPQDVGYIKTILSTKDESERGFEVKGDYDSSLILKVGTECNRSKHLKTMLLYRIIYLADYLYSRPFKDRNKTIVPWVNLIFGVAPRVDLNLCNRCGICLAICPVEAISCRGRIRIDYKKCLPLRCMRCYAECPQGAIKLRRKG